MSDKKTGHEWQENVDRGDINAMRELEYWQTKASDNYDAMVDAVTEIGRIRGLLLLAFGEIRAYAFSLPPGHPKASNLFGLADRISAELDRTLPATSRSLEGE